MQLRNVESALQLVDRALSLNSNVPDIYLHRAKIMRFAGNHHQAAINTEQARKLDLADRQLNAISSKYLLRSNQVSLAVSTMKLCMPTPESGYFGTNVHEVENMWFEYH